MAARESLIDFACATHPDFRPSRHHLLIADRLEAVERGEIDRLMIFMPPRHGKSELASHRFPAWYLGRNPRRQVIAAAYNAEKAADYGRVVRNLLASPDFAAIFPEAGLARDSRAADRLNTAQGGTYVAAGVATAITGRGAHLLLIDDPVKSRAEADSERKRETIDLWYRSTAFTRLMPDGAVVLIQTRWHEDDLAGRLLEREADQWFVLDLPAIDAAGEALWPEWFGLPRLERIRATIGAREWSAQYQQRPAPDEGTFFQRNWFKQWKRRPEKLNVYGTSDYAVTEGRGDYTVHQVWGVGPDGDLYRLDMWRGQTGSLAWIESKLDLVEKHKPLAWFGEAGAIRNAVEPMLRRRMRERGVYCRLEWLPSIHDKPARARGFQSRCEMGMVWLEPGADLSEYLTFPAGRHDDQVDASSLIGRALEMAHPAVVNISAPAKRKDRWDRAFERKDRDY